MTILYLSRKNIIPVDYELGYIIGLLLARKYLYAYVRQQECVLFDEKYTGTQFLSYLPIFNFRNTVEYRNETFILSGNLFKQIKRLVQYLDNRMATDYKICQFQPFVKGIHDIFVKPGITFSHKNIQVIEYVQKIFWYWYELKTQITTQEARQHQRRKYFLNLLHPIGNHL